MGTLPLEKENSMNLNAFKNELRMDIRRMQAALFALEGSEMMETTETATASKLSAETRQKIADSMKASWDATLPNPRKRELTKAVKDKIAASQRARWAKKKEAAQTSAAA